MASVNTGIAVAFGIVGTITFTTGGGTALTHYKETLDVEHDFQEDEIRDDDNEIRGEVLSGGVLKASCLFTPKASTIAGLVAALVHPAKGEIITVSGTKDTTLPNYKWGYVGGWKIAYKKNGVATYSFNMKASEDTAVNIFAVLS